LFSIPTLSHLEGSPFKIIYMYCLLLYILHRFGPFKSVCLEVVIEIDVMAQLCVFLRIILFYFIPLLNYSHSVTVQIKELVCEAVKG